MNSKALTYLNLTEIASIPEVKELTLMLNHTPRPPKIKGRVVDVRTEPKIGRNEPCPCDSGKKYKRCCINNKT